MAEKGLVMDLKDNNIVLIKMKRTEACAKCGACSAGMTEKDMFVEAENFCNAKKGEWVELELSENRFLSAVLIMYGIPFLALVSGIVLGYFVIYKFFDFINRDILSFFIGIIFTFIVYMWIRSQEYRWANRKYRPIASKIVDINE